jgi:hypothetical protein
MTRPIDTLAYPNVESARVRDGFGYDGYCGVFLLTARRMHGCRRKGASRRDRAAKVAAGTNAARGRALTEKAAEKARLLRLARKQKDGDATHA